jgi:hypothetical protein
MKTPTLTPTARGFITLQVRPAAPRMLDGGGRRDLYTDRLTGNVAIQIKLPRNRA